MCRKHLGNCSFWTYSPRLWKKNHSNSDKHIILCCLIMAGRHWDFTLTSTITLEGLLDLPAMGTYYNPYSGSRFFCCCCSLGFLFFVLCFYFIFILLVFFCYCCCFVFKSEHYFSYRSIFHCEISCSLHWCFAIMPAYNLHILRPISASAFIVSYIFSLLKFLEYWDTSEPEKEWYIISFMTAIYLM